MKNVLFLSALIIFSNCNRMRYEQRLKIQGILNVIGSTHLNNLQLRQGIKPLQRLVLHLNK